MLQYLPYVFCMLICPVGMGLVMWMGMRTGQGSSQSVPSRPAKEPQFLAAARRSQGRQTREGSSVMSMITSCMKHCLNWKVLAGLAVVALGIGVMAPQWFSIALPTLLVLICPLSMLTMLLAMGFAKRNREQTSTSCCTQSAGPSSEVAPESVVVKMPKSKRAERDLVKY